MTAPEDFPVDLVEHAATRWAFDGWGQRQIEAEIPRYFGWANLALTRFFADHGAEFPGLVGIELIKAVLGERCQASDARIKEYLFAFAERDRIAYEEWVRERKRIDGLIAKRRTVEEAARTAARERTQRIAREIEFHKHAALLRDSIDRALREKLIFLAHQGGAKQVALAKIWLISPSRIAQILRSVERKNRKLYRRAHLAIPIAPLGDEHLRDVWMTFRPSADPRFQFMEPADGT